jgi:formylmethanofuran:tetrahydromethanopterin formyltransferase
MEDEFKPREDIIEKLNQLGAPEAVESTKRLDGIVSDFDGDVIRMAAEIEALRKALAPTEQHLGK